MQVNAPKPDQNQAPNPNIRVKLQTTTLSSKRSQQKSIEWTIASSNRWTLACHHTCLLWQERTLLKLARLLAHNTGISHGCNSCKKFQPTLNSRWCYIGNNSRNSTCRGGRKVVVFQHDKWTATKFHLIGMIRIFGVGNRDSWYPRSFPEPRGHICNTSTILALIPAMHTTL